jgi:hypothetical protein
MLDRNGGRAGHGWEEQRMLLRRLVARLQARRRWDHHNETPLGGKMGSERRNRLEAEGMMLRI